MVMAPFFDKNGRKKGAWSEDEDNKLRTYIERYGHYNWRELPKLADLSRCGKSCRLRWKNYLSPNVKLGNFSKEEEDVIVALQNKLGNKWSKIAERLPGRSDNEIKNHWHAHLKTSNQRDQTMSKDERIGCLKANKSRPKVSHVIKQSNYKPQEERVETLPVTIPSSQIFPSTSSATSSACSLSDFNNATSSHVATQSFDEYINLEGDFWTEPFLLDTSSIYQSDILLSPLDLANDFTLQASSYQDITMMNGSFLSSMLDF